MSLVVVIKGPVAKAGTIFILLSKIGIVDEGACCYAFTAKCMACRLKQTEAEYCQENPETAGCSPSSKYWHLICIYDYSGM